ncbi:MAG TPA: BON domain-containing protein [Rhodanobacteraceae bacterium]|nr:BON domain-containing protein [Rhodanobacteraceae bacterium]
MKTRIAVTVASLLVASLGTAAYAQTTPPSNPPQPASPMTSAPMTSNGQSDQNGSMSGTMSSAQVEQKVKKELTSHGVTATNVNVAFDNGTATLTGTVYNQRDISKAKKAAMRVRGVKSVDTSGLHARASHSNKHGQG